MIKKTQNKIAFVVLLLVTLHSNAQQEPNFTQYLYNMNILNPAYAGTKDAISLGFQGRSQWMGLNGAPQTQTLAIHAPINDFVGLGFSAIHDVIGPVSQTDINGDFSYKLEMGRFSYLALGMKVGASFMSIDGLEFIESGDPLDETMQLTLFNVGIGAFYYSDRFYVGLSSPSILESKYIKGTAGVYSTSKDKMHIYLSGGYVFDLDYKKGFKIKPAFLLRAVQGTPLSFDFSTHVWYKDQLGVGIGYRFEDSMNLTFSFRTESNFTIGYAYDYTLSKLTDFNSGSHEIYLQYDFDLRSRLIPEPRFF